MHLLIHDVLYLVLLHGHAMLPANMGLDPLSILHSDLTALCALEVFSLAHESLDVNILIQFIGMTCS